MLRRLLPATTRARFADFIHDHLGALASNFLFGILLGITPWIGKILELPLDIRHIAFSSANLAYATASHPEGIGVFAQGLFAVIAIGLVNLWVSFALALRVAPFAQPEWSALALMQAPATVQEVHAAYIAAGAETLTTNSYALVPFHIGEERFHARAGELAALAGKLARQAVTASGKNVTIAGSLPPLFGSYRPDLFDPARAAEIARPLIDGQAPYTDLWLAETQSSIAEVRALHALTARDRPFWASFTLEDEPPAELPRLRSGETVAAAVAAALELKLDALLFNCSHPEAMTAALKTARVALDAAGSAMRLGVYANAFAAHGTDEEALPANDGLDEIRTDLTPAAYLDWAKRWRAAGADIIGGCCGVGPEHIAALAAWRAQNA